MAAVATTTDALQLSTTDRPFRGYDLPLDMTTYGIPLAFVVLVVMILCMVIMYTKAKRRRERQMRGPRDNLRSISGGVPMNVAAYRNYGMHLATPTPGGAFSGEHLTAGYPADLPPPYEVAIQTPPSGTSVQTYSTGVSMMPAPPAYRESLTAGPGLPPGPDPVADQPGHGPNPPSIGSEHTGSAPAGEVGTTLNTVAPGETSSKKESDPSQVDCNPRVPKPQAGTSDGDGNTPPTPGP